MILSSRSTSWLKIIHSVLHVAGIFFQIAWQKREEAPDGCVWQCLGHWVHDAIFEVDKGLFHCQAGKANHSLEWSASCASVLGNPTPVVVLLVRPHTYSKHHCASYGGGVCEGHAAHKTPTSLRPREPQCCGQTGRKRQQLQHSGLCPLSGSGNRGSEGHRTVGTGCCLGVT